MRVLVVEDDQTLGVFLQKGLMLEGHDVDLVGDGDAALELARQQAPDLMVLDLGLPCRDGTDVLEVMRKEFGATAILVLTGRSEVKERVRCLDLGADDFVLKPFSFHELMARCRALLRRRERFADPVLRFGGLEMNRMERTVSYDSVRIDLTTKEFTLMEFLMLKRGSCSSRSELLSQAWHSTPETDTNIIDVYINYLRKKLSASHPEEISVESAIETVRGSGYRLRDRRKIPRLEKPVEEGELAENSLQARVEFARGA
jgi:DNA-binding response OmpR family regulator